MTNTITVLAPARLAPGKTESELLAASDKFQEEFVRLQPGILRRELVKRADGEYLDIVQFCSREDADDVIEKEKTSKACHDFFAFLDMTDMDESDIEITISLATYA